MPDQLTLTEAVGTLGNMQAADPPTGRFRALLIKAGWGSCGYYSEAVLRRDGPKVWPAGTHNYLDHPTLTEDIEQPERSVKDLASITLTDPVWDVAEGGLVADVEVFPQWRSVLNKEFASKIGLSIRAAGTAEDGEAEGRTGPIITSLVEGLSVDWVTQAGAGGRVLELIESARKAPAKPAERAKPLREARRNVGQWMEARIHSHFTEMADGMYGNGQLSRPERLGLSSAIGEGLTSFTDRVTGDHPQLYERDIYDGPPDENGSPIVEALRRRFREAHGMTANELSSALSDAVRENYGGDKIYTWLRDYTDEWVVFTVEDASDCDLYQQTYTVDEETQEVTLTGEPVEVVARTTYVPAPADPDEPAEPADGSLTETDPQNAPGSKPADTKKKKEGVMPELTEAEARELTEARDKAQADAAKAQADKAASDLQLARFRAAESARPIASKALSESTLPVPAQVRILGTFTADSVPLTDAGVLDEAALRTRVEDAIKAEGTYLASIAEESGQGQPRGLGESGTKTGEGAQVDAAETNTALVEAYKSKGLSPAAAQLAATGRPF